MRLGEQSVWSIGSLTLRGGRALTTAISKTCSSLQMRRSGIGAALVEHVRAWAAAHGSAKVYWLTAASNGAARALYDQVAAETGFIQYQITL